MIARIGPVTDVQQTGSTSASAYRSPLIPSVNTNGISVHATSLGLLSAVGCTVGKGRFLNGATARLPVAVLGAAAAQRLGIDRIYPGERIWVCGQWLYIAGILSQSVLAATANPESPNEVNVSQPSAALSARAQADSALNGLFLGLGAVSLLVGAVGVANIMLISVLERRSEIGLRRSLGATRSHIRIQFLAEAVLLAILGGAAGVAAGVIATAIYASNRGWSVAVPTVAWVGGLGAALVIGALAGLLPAIRAARLSPTEALRTV
jgi:putative ABC transport system permease protein